MKVLSTYTMVLLLVVVPVPVLLPVSLVALPPPLEPSGLGG
jgi:hypothetical protein